MFPAASSDLSVPISDLLFREPSAWENFAKGAFALCLVAACWTVSGLVVALLRKRLRLSSVLAVALAGLVGGTLLFWTAATSGRAEDRERRAANKATLEGVWTNVRFSPSDLWCVKRVVGDGDDQCESGRTVEGRDVELVFYTHKDRLHVDLDTTRALGLDDDLG